MKKKPANVRVAHIRFPAEDGSIDNRGGITIAAVIGDNHQVEHFAVARCHRADNYNKLLGWNKAVGRVIAKKGYQIPELPIEWRELVKLYRDYAEQGISYAGTV